MHKIFSNNLGNSDKKLTTYLNLYSYMLARNNKDIFNYFNIYVDGIIFVWILKAFGFVKVFRKSFDMTSMAPEIFNKAIFEKKSIYFIGSKPELIDKTIRNISENFPNLNICGFRDGYFDNDDRPAIFDAINSLNADYVICGMGTLLQEQFLVDLQKTGWEGQGYTCGGFLHQTSVNIQYYPKWIDKFNLRGFYRMFDEPKLLSRYFLWYPFAVMKYFYDSVIYNISKRKN